MGGLPDIIQYEQHPMRPGFLDKRLAGSLLLADFLNVFVTMCFALSV